MERHHGQARAVDGRAEVTDFEPDAIARRKGDDPRPEPHRSMPANGTADEQQAWAMLLSDASQGAEPASERSKRGRTRERADPVQGEVERKAWAEALEPQARPSRAGGGGAREVNAGKAWADVIGRRSVLAGQGKPEHPDLAFDTRALTEAVARIVEPMQGSMKVSVHIRDLETQQVLIDRLGDAPFVPASCQKLLTSSAALDLLGADYRFRTEVASAGKDLYIVGTGDPVLEVGSLARLTETVAERIDLSGFGRIVVDDHVFEAPFLGPGYPVDGLGRAHEARSGALSIEFNTLRVTVVPTRPGQPPKVSLEPDSTEATILNRATTGRSGSLVVRTLVDEGKTVVDVSGTVARTVTVRRRTGDPGLFAAGVLAKQLVAEGAPESFAVARGRRPSSATTVATLESPPLIEILGRGLAFSNNFMAEQLLRTIAWRTADTDGEWERGQDLLEAYWSAVSGAEEPVVVENGSGLSQRGRLTTSGLVDLLSSAFKTSSAGASLLEALPIAGNPGTLQGRLRHTHKRVRAKTGTLDGVSALTGVITCRDGRPRFAFSILGNVEPGKTVPVRKRRSMEDHIVMAALTLLDETERSGTLDPC